SYHQLRNDATIRAASLLREIDTMKVGLRKTTTAKPERGHKALIALGVGVCLVIGAALVVTAARPRKSGDTATGTIRTSVSTQLTNARQLGESGKLDDALAIYQQVLKDDKDNVEALSYSSLFMALNGRPITEAITSVNHAEEVDPSYPDAHL